MNPVIIIPTYVSARRRKDGAGMMSTYDHTTPLSSQGELPRLLRSLEGVEGARDIIILVASERSIEQQATEKIQVVAAHFPTLNTMVIGTAELSLIQQRMEQLQLGRLNAEISLTGYGAIRNLGLIVANIMGFDSVIYLDDDEVVDDPEFLKKAVYGLGKFTKKGIPILAKTGFFRTEKGSYLAEDNSKWYDKAWDQAKLFNSWITTAMRGPRLSRSNVVCGGCLAVHREAYKRVAFDPWIPRGEDLDYLLNLRMYGADLWFDNAWSLKHQPPKSIPEGVRFRQDVYRWLYEFRKLEYSGTQIDLLQIRPSSLEPYPGPFLDPSITKRISKTIFMRKIFSPERASYRKVAKVAKSEAATYASRHCHKYFELQFVWSEIIARTADDAILRQALAQSMAIRQSDAGAVSPAVQAQMTGIDPGATCEIQLNVQE